MEIVLNVFQLRIQSSESESESDQEAEQCPICLLRIKDQDVGTPESCDHNFCLECIQEWAKVGSCLTNESYNIFSEVVIRLCFVENTIFIVEHKSMSNGPPCFQDDFCTTWCGWCYL